jgi:hypothetical protein
MGHPQPKCAGPRASKTGQFWALLLGLFLVAPSHARADTVLFACSENCPLSLFEALELELRGHGAFLVARLDPSGFTVAAHEADARRMASLVPAAAVLWIERESPLRIRVLTARDTNVREAPLSAPPEQIDPRSFAAIAGNVVLQAIAAPGHTDNVAGPPSAAAAAAPALAAQPTASPMTPISEKDSGSWPKAKAEPRFRRFFLRAGAALGFAYVKSGMSADRAPPLDLVNTALTMEQASDSPGAGQEYLAANGYDCDWQLQQQQDVYVASNCDVAVSTSGFVFTPALDIQTGAYLTPRFALAVFLRIQPDAGFGTFNHVLFGAQGEYALTKPNPKGFWANVGVGFGGGRLQVQPPNQGKRTPYVTSGPLETHVFAALGYRFLPYFGLYATPTVRLMFPDVLFMVEPTLGLEGRL